MQVSYSRIQTFNNCPYQYYLRYKKNLTTLATDDPTSPLILGHALHTGIELTTEEAVKEYYNSYPIINDSHINEVIKFEYWIPKIKELLPTGEHEVKIEDEDFIGFIDLLVPVEKEVKYNLVDNYETGYEYQIDINDSMDPTQYFDLYDFKYSNNIKNYMGSEQLHLYKYYFEKLNPNKKIRDMYFMFVPKCNLKIKEKNKTNKRDETTEEFRKRIIADLETKKIEFAQIQYNPDKVIDFLTNAKHTIECTDFYKNKTRLCDWCEYKRYCQTGVDYELIEKDVK